MQKMRHEVKYEISNLELIILRQRLKCVMKLDKYTIDGKYKVRSLYFDNIENKALNEKIDGVNIRDKYS